jgi:hypothetical protein
MYGATIDTAEGFLHRAIGQTSWDPNLTVVIRQYAGNANDRCHVADCGRVRYSPYSDACATHVCKYGWCQQTAADLHILPYRSVECPRVYCKKHLDLCVMINEVLFFVLTQCLVCASIAGWVHVMLAQVQPLDRTQQLLNTALGAFISTAVSCNWVLLLHVDLQQWLLRDNALAQACLPRAPRLQLPCWWLVDHMHNTGGCAAVAWSLTYATLWISFVVSLHMSPPRTKETSIGVACTVLPLLWPPLVLVPWREIGKGLLRSVCSVCAVEDAHSAPPLLFA